MNNSHKHIPSDETTLWSRCVVCKEVISQAKIVRGLPYLTGKWRINHGRVARMLAPYPWEL